MPSAEVACTVVSNLWPVWMAAWAICPEMRSRISPNMPTSGSMRKNAIMADSKGLWALPLAWR